jgi:hypothetical protein
VGGDDDRLVALAREHRDDVPLRAAGDEAAGDANACRRALAREQALGVGARDEGRRTDDDLSRTAADERDRVAADRASLEARQLAAASVLDGEHVHGGERLCALGADVAHTALDDAFRRVRVHARAGVPAFAVDLELRLLGVVAEQRELLEARLEPRSAQRLGDRLRGPRRLRRSGGADADLDAERLEEVHAPSLSRCRGAFGTRTGLIILASS